MGTVQISPIAALAGSLVQIGGPQSPKSTCLIFEVDLI